MVDELIGARIKRLEDPKFLMGRGKYIADLRMPGMAEVVFIRSPHAHAYIKGIDIRNALSHPDTIAVLTGEEVNRWAKPFKTESSSVHKACNFPVLAKDKVRFFGEAVAVVVARDRYLAEDVTELVRVEYEPLPPIMDEEKAMEPEAPRLHEELPDNILVFRKFESGEIGKAFQEADFILRETFKSHRHIAAPIETRGCIAQYDPGMGMLTLWTANQVPHLVRLGLAMTLDFPEHKIRVIIPDVGGGYGGKGGLYPEEVVVCLLAIKLCRPVRWIEDRIENFTAATHAWEQTHHVEVAVSKDGIISGLKDKIICNTGAYAIWGSTAAAEPIMAGGLLPGPYKIRNYYCETYGVATNKSPTAPYRGIARPPIVFVMEGAMDLIARELNMDPGDMRLKNMIQPDDFPYTSATRVVHDKASYVESLKKALEVINYPQLRKEQESLRNDGRYIGIGISCYAELTGLGSGTSIIPGAQYLRPGNDPVTVRVIPSGKVIVLIGMPSQGQGLATALAQVVAQELGVDLDDITVINNDTAIVPYGIGTMASRGAVIGGGGAILACQKIKEKALKIAARFLEARLEDLEFEKGRVMVKGVPEKGLTLQEVAHAAYFQIHKLPRDITPCLETTEYYDTKFGTFANATHIAVVEMDMETGIPKIQRYLAVDDCGRMINPMIVEGQVIGGTAQGLSGALYERIVYDEMGQLLTTTFMDYALLKATEAPEIEVTHLETPSQITLGGFKGVGEGGAIAPPAALVNAINDALSPFKISLKEFPVLSDKIIARKDIDNLSV